jgi:hypothetical protein
MGTARITSNSTGNPNNLLDCKLRRQNKDVRCGFEQPIPIPRSPTIHFTSTVAKWSLKTLQVKNMTTRGSLWGRNDTFKFEMNINNPNNSFIVPGSVSPARRESLPRVEPEAFCSGHWERDGWAARDEFFDDINFSLKTNCTNKVTIGANYYRPISGPAHLEIYLSSRLHTGVGGMTLGWKVMLITESVSGNGTRDAHFDGNICAWENFEAELRLAEFIHYI